MRPDPHSILLVPTEGDPHGLLREGPCGARAPVVTEWHKLSAGLPPPRTGETRWAAVWDETGWWACEEGRRALVLAWEGQPQPLGFMALVVAAQGVPLPKGRRFWLQTNPSLTGMATAALLAEEMKVGRAVHLGADGRELLASPKERAQIIAQAVDRLQKETTDA